METRRDTWLWHLGIIILLLPAMDFPTVALFRQIVPGEEDVFIFPFPPTRFLIVVVVIGMFLGVPSV